eukprot:6487470-Amphidinium_carterae.1
MFDVSWCEVHGGSSCTAQKEPKGSSAQGAILRHRRARALGHPLWADFLRGCLHGFTQSMRMTLLAEGEDNDEGRGEDHVEQILEPQASFAVHVGLGAWDITHGGVDCLPKKSAAISTTVAIAQGANSYVRVA